MSEALGSSFRDPSGFVFRREGCVYRQVNRGFAPDYDHLMQSGLYARLVERGLLIPHEEVELPPARPEDCYRTLRPEPLAFVSHPYEWCFGQLRDAALATLAIQREALACDATLRDASAYNVQLVDGRARLIDTLSLARYEDGRPWVAYRQFCQHFLAPLALMSLRDVRLAQLLRIHQDGVPLDLATALLPVRSRLRPGLLLHLWLHARTQRRYEDRDPAATPAPAPRLSKRGLAAIVEQLERTVRGLRWAPEGSVWSDYVTGDSYEPAAREHKETLVETHLRALRPACVWDLGANTGHYSRIALRLGSRVVAFDGDPACVEQSWRRVGEEGETGLLPLWLDLANPSPAQGWAHEERASLRERRQADVLLALALIHHLAIGNNVPLESVAAFFADLAPHLVVEFVPKSDPKVKRLLATREDVFPDYTREGFESAFSRHFAIGEATPLRDSERIIYRMHRRSA